MGPYRTPCPPAREPEVAELDGARLAFAVMTVAAAVQVASALVCPVPLAQTLLGASCCVAGLRWLVRHRRR
jgi:hypothetical protein